MEDLVARVGTHPSCRSWQRLCLKENYALRYFTHANHNKGSGLDDSKSLDGLAFIDDDPAGLKRSRNVAQNVQHIPLPCGICLLDASSLQKPEFERSHTDFLAMIWFMVAA